MNELRIFSSTPLSGGRFCVIYCTKRGDRFIPVIAEGSEAVALKEWSSGEYGDAIVPAFVVESTIFGFGAAILYTEIKREDDGMVVGKIVCRQQNEVNKIFNIIEVPVSYAIILGDKTYADDETLSIIGYDDPGDIADLIGIEFEQ